MWLSPAGLFDGLDTIQPETRHEHQVGYQNGQPVTMQEVFANALGSGIDFAKENPVMTRGRVATGVPVLFDVAASRPTPWMTKRPEDRTLVNAGPVAGDYCRASQRLASSRVGMASAENAAKARKR